MTTATLTRPEPQIDSLSVSKPSFEEMSDAIRSHTQCDQDVAEGVVRMLQRAVGNYRQGFTFHLSKTDMHKRHEVFKQIMPDGALPEAGSVHELLNRGLLDDGLMFVHGQEGEIPRYCAVWIEIEPN